MSRSRYISTILREKVLQEKKKQRVDEVHAGLKLVEAISKLTAHFGKQIKKVPKVL